ncbi:hypothetical protein MHYP_G00230220 [Metynnis hypsauchen]
MSHKPQWRLNKAAEGTAEELVLDEPLCVSPSPSLQLALSRTYCPLLLPDAALHCKSAETKESEKTPVYYSCGGFLLQRVNTAGGPTDSKTSKISPNTPFRTHRDTTDPLVYQGLQLDFRSELIAQIKALQRAEQRRLIPAVRLH